MTLSPNFAPRHSPAATVSDRTMLLIAADVASRPRTVRRLPAPPKHVQFRLSDDRRGAAGSTTALDTVPDVRPSVVGAADRRMPEDTERRSRYADAIDGARRVGVLAMPPLRRFALLALVAVCMMSVIAGFGVTRMSSALDTGTERITPAPGHYALASLAATEVRTQEAAMADVAPLRVHVQTQETLLAGGERQFRLALDNDLALGTVRRAGFSEPMLHVDLSILPSRPGSSSVSVTPAQLVVPRSKLHLASVRIEVAPGVSCASDLGELQVRVREQSSAGLRGVAVVALPPVDCGARPPEIREDR